MIMPCMVLCHIVDPISTMALETNFFVSLLLLMLALRFNTGDTLSLPHGAPVTVEIINGFGEAKLAPLVTNVTLHCKSKDDSLGYHTLHVGASYRFQFNRNYFLPTTLFWCFFTWPQDQTRHYIDIYEEDRDECTFCSWKIWSGGACMYDVDGDGYSRCLPWNK